MFQTSLVNLSYYPHLLPISLVINVADIYHPHDCDLDFMRT
jgi:hypothetical protein